MEIKVRVVYMCIYIDLVVYGWGEGGREGGREREGEREKQQCTRSLRFVYSNIYNVIILLTCEYTIFVATDML